MLYHFIGIDVSKAELVVSYQDTKGNWQIRRCANKQKAIEAFLKKLPFSNAFFVFEFTGTYHLLLVNLLAEMQASFSVITPKQSSSFAHMKGIQQRNDEKDAQLLAEYGQLMQPAQYQAPAAHIKQLKQLNRLKYALVKDRVAYQNRLEAAMANPDRNSFVVEKLKSIIEGIKENIAELEAQLSDLAEAELKALKKLAESVCGIGPKTALALLIATNGLQSFNHYKQLVKFIGLCPQLKTSGTSVRKGGGISRAGDPLLRELLYMCARSAKRFNPSCKAIYERLRAKGKCHKVAMVAVMHKLVRQVFAVVKSGIKYDKERYTQILEQQEQKKLAIA